MATGLRPTLKNAFDRIVYKYSFINRILRNINKSLSGVVSFRLRPFGILTVRFKSGLKFKMATNETSSVTKMLFWKGADQYEYTSIFEKLVTKCRTFVDIGANTGYYSILAGVKNTSIQVFAFEPASAPFYYLEKNIRINRLHNVKSYSIALSDTRGEIKFFEIENPKNYHSQYNLAGTGTLKGEDVATQRYVSRQVQTMTLDGWVTSEKIPSIDLIKIDTEGSEHLILSGGSKVLTEQRPIIICETLFHVIEDKLDRTMRKYDYRFYNYRDGRLYETKTLIRETDDGFRDCFFVPSSKLNLIQPFIGHDDTKAQRE